MGSLWERKKNVRLYDLVNKKYFKVANFNILEALDCNSEFSVTRSLHSDVGDVAVLPYKV